MMKNKAVISLIIISSILIIFLGLIGTYTYLLSGNKKNTETVNFVVEPGTSKRTIIKNLKTANVIKSEYATLIYMFFNNDISLKAGTYEIKRNMSSKEIINLMSSGKVKLETIDVTLVEGKNIKDFISLISSKFGYTENEIKEVLNNKEFIKNLIISYDFLTDSILDDNIYYALEGYLFPDTYKFLEDTSIENIIITMLNNTSAKLKSLELSDDVNYHEILTKASICELEAITYSDRQSVAQVINKRLEMNMSLGMDVTTYYAVGKSMKENLTDTDLASRSPYNTRNDYTMAGKLPIGPICNPSLDSIKAALNPSATDYLYFYANVNTREVFFANNCEEFRDIKNELNKK